MNRVLRLALLWFALGALYLTVEILWRGHTHVSMLIVGGLCGVCIGGVNQLPRFYNAKIIVQSAIGAVIVTALEFVSGCVLKLWLGLNVWSYNGYVGNILGQVCLLYALLWFFFMPFAIWAEDTARWLIFWWNEQDGTPPNIPPYSLRSVYAEFFILK
jgi:hypothetical protein